MIVEKLPKNPTSTTSDEARYKARLTAAQEQKTEILNLLKQEYNEKSKAENVEEEVEISTPSSNPEVDLLLQLHENLPLYKRIKNLVVQTSKYQWKKIIRNLKKLFNSNDKSQGEKVFAIFKQLNLKRMQQKLLNQN